MNNTCSSSLHVVLFPFMSKGHTIPMLQLARLLLCRCNAMVTIFTTPANYAYISTSLLDTTITSIISLPFPKNIPGVPSGVESVDKLPSLSLFFPFGCSTKLMQPDFEKAFQSLKTPVTFMVTDAFFDWTLESANKLNIPRLVYYGMSNFAITINQVMSLFHKHLFEGKSEGDPVIVPEIPWLTVTRGEIDPAFIGRDTDSPFAKWVQGNVLAASKSYGIVTNSFFDLKPVYMEYWNSKLGPKSWSVGPFCLGPEVTKTKRLSSQKPSWMVWLDKRLQLGNPVLYVAFGSQAELSQDQIEEIKIGLEKSEVSFLWLMRRSEKGVHANLDDGFEDRVKEKGFVVREWVNQREILEHEIVKGFVSHCGWNSVLESICAGVPILAWPLSAEQPLNAKFVADVIKIGLRVKTCDGSVKGFVKGEELEEKVKELMEGEKGKEVRNQVAELRDSAMKAVEDGGSSWCSLNDLIDELQNKSITS